MESTLKLYLLSLYRTRQPDHRLWTPFLQVPCTHTLFVLTQYPALDAWAETAFQRNLISTIMEVFHEFLFLFFCLLACPEFKLSILSCWNYWVRGYDTLLLFLKSSYHVLSLCQKCSLYLLLKVQNILQKCYIFQEVISVRQTCLISTVMRENQFILLRLVSDPPVHFWTI